MTRVAHVIATPAGVGGAERLLAEIVAAGETAGVEQIVLNPFTVDDSPLEGMVGSVPLRARAYKSVLGLPAQRRWLRDELRTFDPDVVHAMLFRGALSVASLPRHRRPRTMMTHTYGEWARRPPFRLVKEPLDRWAARRFDMIVALAAAGEDMLTKGYGTGTRVVTVAPGWKGDPQDRVDPATRAPTVVCVARLRPEKGHALLLLAFAKARADVPSARLVLIGDGPMRPALEAEAARLGLTDAVDFTGAIPEIWSGLADADVFALASDSEAFGIAVAEAMAAGLPVVAPAVGGILDLVEPGVTGETFPAGDVDGMSRRLVELLLDRERARRMGDAGRRRAQEFRMDVSARRYLTLYDELAPAGGR